MPLLANLARRWETVSCDVAPPGRIGHTFCPNDTGDKAYVYGGVNDTEESASNYLEDFWEYDVIGKRWTQKPLEGDVQSPRAFHTAVWHGDRMYIFGGCNGRGRFNKLFTIQADGVCAAVVLNGVRLIEHQQPSTRYCHSAVVFEHSIYIFGGKCGGRNSNKRLADLYRCRIDNSHSVTWFQCQQLGDPPPRRSAHTALTHERTMMVFGGRSAAGECCEDFFMFHFDTCVWRKIVTNQSPLFGRARNSAVVHHGRVIVFGGWNGKKKLNDLFIYHVEANTFDTAYAVDAHCPSRRECHVAAVCGNTMVVFGGRFRGCFMSDTAELYLGPMTGVESARDWLIDAAMPRAMADALPLRLRELYLTHDTLRRCMNESQGEEDSQLVPDMSLVQ